MTKNIRGVNFLPTPSKQEIYNDNYVYRVRERSFRKILCGHKQGLNILLVFNEVFTFG